jgi:hypothetical protein
MPGRGRRGGADHGQEHEAQGRQAPAARQGVLPLALLLFAQKDYEEVYARLSETLTDWGCWDDPQATVTTGGNTQARQRLGHAPVKRRSAGRAAGGDRGHARDVPGALAEDVHPAACPTAR